MALIIQSFPRSLISIEGPGTFTARLAQSDTVSKGVKMACSMRKVVCIFTITPFVFAFGASNIVHMCSQRLRFVSDDHNMHSCGTIPTILCNTVPSLPETSPTAHTRHILDG
jgi:hypothetical protein